MPSVYNTHIALHLCKLADQSDIPGSKRGQYIGELVSASCGFSLNSIPTMTITLPHGVQVKNDYQEDSYVYSKVLKNIIAQREGVGVYLDISGLHKVPGLPKSAACICLFKGYILEQSVQNDKNGGNTSFGIVHWLTDLTNISIVNRLSSPDNPVDISNNSVFKDFEDESTDAWIPSNEFYQAILKEKNVFVALKTGFQEFMKEDLELKKEEPGWIYGPYYLKALKALDAMQDKSLEFNPAVNVNDMLAIAISEELSKECRNSYMSTTLWQKLVQAFLPQYYTALIPLIDKAYVVPQPGIQISDDVCQTISDNMIISASTQTQHGKTLGAMFISSRAPMIECAFCDAQTRVTRFQYPIPAEPGTMKACTLPGWLEAYNDMTQCLSDASVSSAFQFVDADAGELASTVEPEEADACAQLCTRFVRAAYHAEVTRGNASTLQTVLDLMLPPGAPVKFKVPKDKLVQGVKDTWVYGVIEKVQYTISTKGMSTTYNLSDIRVGDSMMKKLKTDDAILYAKAWTGNEGLYTIEDEIDGKPRIEEAKHK